MYHDLTAGHDRHLNSQTTVYYLYIHPVKAKKLS